MADHVRLRNVRLSYPALKPTPLPEGSGFRALVTWPDFAMEFENAVELNCLKLTGAYELLYDSESNPSRATECAVRVLACCQRAGITWC